MHISINDGLCSGHGRCYDVSPEVFTPDDEGFPEQRGTRFLVAPGAEDVARSGAAACPERAITLVED